MFFGIALKPFVRANPPARGNRRANTDRLNDFDGKVPTQLLELWRKHGFGFYGTSQLGLIDPTEWQPILDRWIETPPDATIRVPIMILPFGQLIYYRKLPEAEDIAVLDPFSRKSEVLSYDPVAFFNGMLTDRVYRDDLVRESLRRTAANEHGALAHNELYVIDQMLLPMQMLKIDKSSALELHTRLRDQVDIEAMPDQPKPDTMASALPPEYLHRFHDTPGEEAGALYIAVYIDWYKALRLDPDGSYDLLYWRIHHKTGARSEIRAYRGPYETFADAETGDRMIALDIQLRDDSLGSDGSDMDLIPALIDGKDLLLVRDGLGGIATKIGRSDTFRFDSDVYVKTGLTAPIPQHADETVTVETVDDLPAVLRAMIPDAPLVARIIAVDDRMTEDGTLMVTVDLGTKDGLRMNMPMMSPADAGKSLYGWVWRLDEGTCGVGLRIEDDADKITRPTVGDVLTTRAD